MHDPLAVCVCVGGGGGMCICVSYLYMINCSHMRPGLLAADELLLGGGGLL